MSTASLAVRLPEVQENQEDAAKSPVKSPNMYCLDVRQQPRQARLASSGEKADRRTVDPAPIVRLRMRRPAARRKSVHTLTDDDFISPALTHAHFCFASLVPENSEEELYDLAGSKSKYVGGSCVSSLFHLKDQSCFVFPDLSVKTEGRWRFKMSLFEIVEDGVVFRDSVLTEVFQVYSPKRYPGNKQLTELSKSLADQGLKLRVRRPGTANNGEEDAGTSQPRRKKAKVTPRQRPTPATAVPSLPPSPSVRRASGPAGFPSYSSSSVPFIAPLGSTSSDPYQQPHQQRPWTSWSGSSSLSGNPRYPSNLSLGSGPPFYPRAPVARSISHDYRRLPQLDERNTAPDPNYDPRFTLPRTIDHSPASSYSARSQMAPPPPPLRQSPTELSHSTFSSAPLPHQTAERPPFVRRFSPTVLAPIRSDLSQPLKSFDSFGNDHESRRTSNESSTRTTTSEEGGGGNGTEATSVPSSEAGGYEKDGEGSQPVRRCSKEGAGGGGSLAMILSEGASDVKQIQDVSFF